MNAIPPHQNALHPRWLLPGILTLVVIAWSGVLDGLSARYIDGALIGSGAIYATARGINALVSVLQGTEMNALLLTFTVGELLDPVNDLIERFSAFMMLALGSLALQKILLEVVSDATFNILLTGLGLGVAAAYHLGSDPVYRKLARFFLLTAAIRFSFTVIILANGWADSVFLEDKVTSRHASMQDFHSELSSISARAGMDAGLPGESEAIAAQMVVNEKAIKAAQQSLDMNRARLAEARAELASIDSRSWWKRLSGETTLEIEQTEARIQKLEKWIEGERLTISGLTDTAQALEKQNDCLERKNRGESCTLLGNLGKASQAFNIRKQISGLSAGVDEFASNLISLMMSLVLKSMIFPLVFLYILMRAIRQAF